MIYKLAEDTYDIYFKMKLGSFIDDGFELVIGINWDAYYDREDVSPFKVIINREKLCEDSVDFPDELEIHYKKMNGEIILFGECLTENYIEPNNVSKKQIEIIDLSKEQFDNIIKIIDRHQDLIRIDTEITNVPVVMDVASEYYFFKGKSFNRAISGVISVFTEKHLESQNLSNDERKAVSNAIAVNKAVKDILSYLKKLGIK